MAIGTCRGCGKQVDTSAKSCPNCGRPKPTRDGTWSTAKILACIFGALFAGIGIQALILPSDQIGRTPTTASAKTEVPPAQPPAQPQAQPQAQPEAQPQARPQAQPEAQPQAQPQAQPPVTVTPEQLKSDYDENEVAAEAKYKDRALLVDAVVAAIDKNYAGQIVLRLRLGKRSAMSAFLDQQDAEKAALLKKGSNITLACTAGMRIMGKPTVRECRIR